MSKLGLGDAIEKGIETVMPKTAAAVKKKGCGCGGRKTTANKVGEILTGK